MALGSNKQNKSAAIMVDLKFNATKGPEAVGFRQVLTKVASATEPGKFDYTYATHDFVEGHVAGFVIREQSVFDKPDEKEFIAYTTLTDPAGGENVVVRFPLNGGAGRKLVGLLNAAKENDGVVHLYTNMVAKGQSIGEKAYDKNTAFINMRKGDAKGERIVPLYTNAEGVPLLTDTGAPQQLAMGVKHVIAKKDIWDFAAADEMTLNTALVLTQHFAKSALGDDHKVHESQGEADGEGVDLNEAAAAAAPHG